jgi:hypothetical protein
MNLSLKFEEALVYATRIHGGQMRKKTQIRIKRRNRPGVSAKKNTSRT